MNPSTDLRPQVIVVGGGPAGLMAAERLAAAGLQVDLYDTMPSVGRKFLLAGKGGLNLTHGEPRDAFVARFRERSGWLAPMLARFGAHELRDWAKGLGIETFVGSSGRVFPVDMKAAPLLRAWLHRLRAGGVRFHMRQRWVGFDAAPASGVPDAPGTASVPGVSAMAASAGPPALRFAGPQGTMCVQADAVLLALGGGSWSRLGSDGAWVGPLLERGVDVAPLRPSNCGFDVARRASDGSLQPGWSARLRQRHAGAPLKNVALSLRGAQGAAFDAVGECVVTEGGLEGSLVYALSALARERIAADGPALLHIDLLPARSATFVRDEVRRPRGSRSLATHLKSRLGLDGVKAALLHELLPRETIADPDALAAAIKALPVMLVAPRPIDEAISSAGGVRAEALDDGLMLRALPGVFCAGEMLDWEAPTGGYLLTASLATAVAAADGVIARLRSGSARTTVTCAT